MAEAAVKDCLFDMSQDAKELYLDSEVPILDAPPSPLEFYRDWVTPNKPVLIRNAIDHWPALQRWTDSYLREKIGSTEVTVAITPNGYADAVNGDRFVMPEERKMAFGSFLDIITSKSRISCINSTNIDSGDHKNSLGLEDTSELTNSSEIDLSEPTVFSESTGVFYVQKQNSNMTDEFKELLEDVDDNIPWASEALNKTPDAVNFWMGEEKAVTSTHKDHYENVYSVIRGHKTFTLLPPTDRPFVPYETYQAAAYKQNDKGQFDIVDDPKTGQVPWIAVDPLKPDLERYPEYRHVHPVTVTVREGEMLYLPSLWFHHVQQSQCCIAVNHWYDMEFDIKYNYFHFVENLTEELRKVAENS